MLVCGFECFENGSLSASYIYKHVMTSVAESAANHQCDNLHVHTKQQISRLYE